MEKVYTKETGELFLGHFITDGTPYVIGCSVVNVLGKGSLEESDVGLIILIGWTFIAVLDGERRIEKILINPEVANGERNTDEFLKVFDWELEKKLALDSYLFSSDSQEDRYLEVREKK